LAVIFIRSSQPETAEASHRRLYDTLDIFTKGGWVICHSEITKIDFSQLDKTDTCSYLKQDYFSHVYGPVLDRKSCKPSWSERSV
jgi:hypothetical protein